VSRQRRLAILITLLVAFVLDAAWATPVRAAKEAKSIACCARSCAKLRAVTCESACCAATRSPQSPAVSAAGTNDRAHPATVGEPAISVLASARGPARSSLTLGPAGNDPPPVFLLTRTLRL
jgi:hypothetical protein